jgi:predicted TIM-barrel fold metal-dependent hydrolase
MPLIDLQCHYGVTPAAIAVRPPELAQASAYADRFAIELLCFSSREALSDMDGGNARLAQILGSDKRFRGWVSLSPHQPDQSQTLARQYLVKPLWVGARFEQHSDADAINSAGGHEVLNGLRRYSRPVLVTASTPATLAAAISVAREFNTLRFLLSPQSEALTANAVAAIKETVNMSLLPSVAFTERGVVEQAIATLGERRVLWGSDWGVYQPSSALGMIKDSAISPAQRERMVYRNAREFLDQ